MGRRKKEYPAFGCRITAEEAAQLCTVSIYTFKKRLWELGNSMEEALKYYDRRYGGVIDKMKDAKGLPTEEARAAEEILNAIFDETRAERVAVATPTALEPEEKDEEETIPEEPTEEQETEELLMDTEDADDTADTADTWEFEVAKPDRGELKLLNDAVEALEKLTESEIEVQSGTWDRTHDLLDRLKEERVSGFEALVDWRALEVEDEKV